LPDEGKDELLVTVLDVNVTDTNSLNLELLEGIECNLTVDADLEVVIGVFLDTVPLNDSFIDLVDDLEENLTVSHILVQVIDSAVRDFEGVDPETELTLFTRSFHILIDAALISLLFVELLKTVSSVENLGNVDGIDLGVTLNPIVGVNNIGYVDSSGVLHHFFCTDNLVFFSHSVKWALLFIKLV